MMWRTFNFLVRLRIKKILVILLLVMMLFLVGCGKEVEVPTKQEELVVNDEYNDIKDEDFDISKYEAREVPFVFVEKLSRLDNYRKETVGETLAKVLFSFRQDIHNVFEGRLGDYHLVTISSSSLVNVYHEAYFKESVSYRDKDSDEYSTCSYEDYISEYGFLPYGKNLEGFIITTDNIININDINIEKNGDLYSFHLELDGNIGAAGIKHQMMKFGGLNGEPIFSSVEMNIVMTSNFTPVTIHLKSSYTVNYPVLGNTKCTQEYTVTYSFEGK